MVMVCDGVGSRRKMPMFGARGRKEGSGSEGRHRRAGEGVYVHEG